VDGIVVGAIVVILWLGGLWFVVFVGWVLDRGMLIAKGNIDVDG